VPRPATGQVIHHGEGYTARVRVAANDRRPFRLAVSSDTEAEERNALLVALALRLRPHATADEIAKLVQRAAGAAGATAKKTLQEIEEAACLIESGETATASSALAPSFADFAKSWTSGELRKKHPDHVRDKDHDRDVQILRMYVNPCMRTKRITDVTLDDCERVMANLPRHLSPATRRHVAQCMRKVLSFAVYPGRYLPANPIPREWMPKVPRSGAKAMACLYPAEDAKLLGCRAVPLERRIAYGVLIREGMRAGELELLRWRDLDLAHGRVRLDENKTDDPRAWALSPDVVRALTWWKKRSGADDDALVVGLDLGDGAWWLRGDAHFDPKKPETSTNRRGDLRTAGVTRRELFERTASRLPIRLHDLRASFVTISLAAGRTEAWVTDRTGHKSSQMLARYARQARTWSELDMGGLQPMDRLLPEMHPRRVGGGSATPPRAARGAATRRAPSPPRGRHSSGVERAASGGPSGIRTRDLRIKSPQLYRLSYRPVGCSTSTVHSLQPRAVACPLTDPPALACT